MGIERLYRIVQNKGINNNIATYLFLLCVYLAFLWHLEVFQNDSSQFIYREEYREAKSRQRRSKTPLNVMKTDVIHTKRKSKSILLFFSLILNYSVRSIYSHTNSYKNVFAQSHVDGAQRAWATWASPTANVMCDIHLFSECFKIANQFFFLIPFSRRQSLICKQLIFDKVLASL